MLCLGCEDIVARSVWDNKKNLLLRATREMDNVFAVYVTLLLCVCVDTDK